MAEFERERPSQHPNEDLLNTFFQAIEQGRVQSAPHDVLANDSSIVVLPKSAEWRTAKRGMDVYHLEQGQIIEIWLTEWDAPG